MERLTVKHWRNLDPWECCGQDDYCLRSSRQPGGCINGCPVPKLYAKLAMYEETGLTPDDVDKLIRVSKKGKNADDAMQ